MRRLPIYQVTVNTEGKPGWSRAFIGLPSTTEILCALKEDQSESEASAPYYENLMTLVRDHKLPNVVKNENIQVCTYAGIHVGSIRINEHQAAVITVALLEAYLNGAQDDA